MASLSFAAGSHDGGERRRWKLRQAEDLGGLLGQLDGGAGAAALLAGFVAEEERQVTGGAVAEAQDLRADLERP